MDQFRLIYYVLETIDKKSWPKLQRVEPHFIDNRNKTFTENWDSKHHLLELSWPILDYGLNHIFWNILFCFLCKIESWNFQDLFEKEFRETSQNFNSISKGRKKWK